MGAPRRARGDDAPTIAAASTPAGGRREVHDEPVAERGQRDALDVLERTCGRPSSSACTLAPRSSAWPPRGLEP
jgi:hypothetical protein